MWLHLLQDVDAQLQEFDTKQNIDIGLIIGGKHGAANEPIEDQMDMRQRAGDMHMGHSRSLSAGEPAAGAGMAENTWLGCRGSFQGVELDHSTQKSAKPG